MVEAARVRQPVPGGVSQGEYARRSTWAWSLLIFCAALLLFGSAHSFSLTLDSVPIVGADPRVANGEAAALLSGDWWNLQSDADNNDARPSLWRPLSKLWLSLLHPRDGELRGESHALPIIMWGNVLLHAVLSVLRFRLLLELLRPRRWALPAAVIAALALAVHPAHTESVGTAVGAADSLAAIFVTAALWLQLRSANSVLQGVAVLIALGCKESAVVAPAFAFLIAFATGAGLWRALRDSVTSLIALALFLVLRTAVLGDALGVSDPVFALFSSTERICTALAVVAMYDLQALLLPFWLHPNLTLLDIPPAAGFGDWRALAGLAVLLGTALGAWLLLRRGQRLAACGVAMFLCALFPVSNLPFSIGALGATRFLVLPLLGWGLVLAALTAHLLESRHARSGVALLVIGCVALPAAATWRELPRWRNDATLFTSMTERSPGNAFGWYNLGVHEQQHGYSQAAARHFAVAASLPLPRIPSSALVQEDLLESAFQARMNAAGLALQAGQRSDAERAREHYRAAVQLCEEGHRSSAAQPGRTRWPHLHAEALVGCARTEAVLLPPRGTHAVAQQLLDKAAQAEAANSSIDSTRAWIAELEGDVATALRLHEALEVRTRARWAFDHSARGIARERAALLQRVGRGTEARKLLAEVDAAEALSRGPR